MIYTVLKKVMAFLFKVFYRFEAEGRDKIPLNGPAIIAANHCSYTDPVIIAIVAARPVSFMAKQELFRIPVFGRLISILHAFPVRRGGLDRIALQKALDVLSKDQLIGIFPEGTRHRLEGKLGPVEEGMALLALKSNVPVVPLAIIGSDKIMPEGKWWPRFPKIKVRIGTVIDPGNISLPEKQKRKQLTRIWAEEIDLLLRSEQ